MHNESLFYLLSVKKLALDHVKRTHRANAMDSNCAVHNFHMHYQVVMVLVSRQSPTYDQNLNFQFNFKNKSGRTVPDQRIIHLLNFKEVHRHHISAYRPIFLVYHQGQNITYITAPL